MQAMRPNNNNNNDDDDDDDDHTSPVSERPRGWRISQETDDLRDSAFQTSLHDNSAINCYGYPRHFRQAQCGHLAVSGC